MHPLNLELFLIPCHAPLRDAMQKISANHLGLIMITDDKGAVIGIATDGDIRQRLVNGTLLTESVIEVANTNFVWADEETPREMLLKQLDHHIRAIPLLDKNRRLTGIISRDHFPVPQEEPVYSRARAPARVSFGGGGSDLTHFFADDNGAVINATISLYSHASMRMRPDKRIIIHSCDIGEVLEADNLTSALEKKGKFGLIQALLKAIHPEYGFELYLHSDFPMKSGLGGSAVVASATLGCFNQFRRDKWDSHELAEVAFQAERLYLGVAGGWQDQYASVFGGFNFMEFKMEQNIVHPLRIPCDVLLELEENLVLCNTGKPHDSGDIHLDQEKQMQSESVRQKVQSNVDLTYRMRNYLLRGKLLDFGKCMHEAWQLKRHFSSKISNPWLDNVYDNAIKHGAIGGKLLGAGGGGFFLFYTTPFEKHRLIAHLISQNLEICSFRFDQDGLRTWSSRENRTHEKVMC